MSQLAKESKESKKEKRDRKKEKKEKKKSRTADKESIEVGQDSGKSEDLEGTIEPASAKAESDSELEIDLNAAVPLSRKKQRLLKKGKLDLDRLARKNPAPKPLTEEGTEPEVVSSKKSPFGVWIGNLAFDTTKEDLIRFVISETKDHVGELMAIQKEDISRVNLPKKNDKIKGFAYLDLPSHEHVKSVIALSERNLNGRNLLIKDSISFEGRPEDHKAQGAGQAKPLSKNPPSRILFVGNLSFDTTDDLLEEHFRGCGKITKIRMATFEDSGKCKGFAFIDFVNEDGPTAALKSKILRTFINRPLRLEYGEDRSKRNPKKMEAERTRESRSTESRSTESRSTESRESRDPRDHREYSERDGISSESKRNQGQEWNEQKPKSFKRPAERSHDPSKRMKSSIALATAQRQSMAIVPSQGKKFKFD